MRYSEEDDILLAAPLCWPYLELNTNVAPEDIYKRDRNEDPRDIVFGVKIDEP